MLDIPVPKIVLDRAGIVSIASELEAGGMTQHVGMSLEWKASLKRGALDQPIKAIRRKRAASLADE